VKALAFSDLHVDLDQARVLVEQAADADLVIGAGDFASVHEGLDETIGVLSAIRTPTVLVPGNNETDEALRSACRDWAAATVLHGEGTNVDGLDVFGLGARIPVTPWGWSFDLDEEEVLGAARRLPRECPAGGSLPAARAL
jgi:Icc-related predicted phosphoesterase